MANVGINFVTSGEQVVIGALRKIGEIGIDALGAAAGALADFAKDSFAGAIEAQTGMDELAASILRVGDAAPITFDGALELAEQFKNLVGGSDDVVLAMTNVGLRFSKIGDDIFPRFIEQASDLATVLKLDPVKAAELLGKVLQDLGTDGVGSIGRLKAAGIQLTEAQEEQIKNLVELGDVTEAQTVLMDALAATTGGAAAAAAGTAAGQWAIFRETIADAGEGVALQLMPALTALMSQVLPALIPIITQVADAASAWIVGTFIPAFMQAVEWIQTNWPTIQTAIIDMWIQAQPALQAISDFVVTVMIPALQTAVAWVQTNWPTIRAVIQTVMVTVQTVIQTVLSAIQAFWTQWGDEIIGVLNFFVTQYATIFSAFSAAFAGDWRKFGEILRVAWSNAVDAIIKLGERMGAWFVSQDWGAIGRNIVAGIGAGISAAARGLADAAIAAARAALDAVKGFLGIQSPSAAFAEIGANMMAGMARGISGNAGVPAYAGVQAASGVMRATYLGGVTVNVNGAGNPAAVAVAVRAELDRIGSTADSRSRTGSR
jgi:hypothetical protein